MRRDHEYQNSKPSHRWELQVRHADHLCIAAGPHHVGFDLRVGSSDNRSSYYYWKATGKAGNPLGSRENRHDSLVAAGEYANDLIDALNKQKEYA